MARFDVKPGFRFGEWTTVERLGGGGNGVVWKAQHDAGRVGALKTLKFPDRKRSAQRFNDEIAAMRSCQDIVGVMPLLDFALTQNIAKSPSAWFVAPIGKPLSDYEKKIELSEAVAICQALATTLEHMHARFCGL